MKLGINYLGLGLCLLIACFGCDTTQVKGKVIVSTPSDYMNQVKLSDGTVLNIHSNRELEKGSIVTLDKNGGAYYLNNQRAEKEF